MLEQPSKEALQTLNKGRVETTMDNATQQCWQAITSLYKCCSKLSGLPQEQQAAGKWLNEFADQTEAPQVSLELLQADQPTEVQFFCANMLFTAVKRRWTRMEPWLQEKIKLKLNQQMEVDRHNAFALAWIAVQRLIMAYASIAAVSGPESLRIAVSQALAQANKGGLLVALELLAGIAEAAGALHRRQRAEALPALPPLAPGVFSLVLHALHDPKGKDAQKAAALNCLSAWLRLNSSETSNALTSPGTFRTSQKGLFDTVLGLLSSPNDDIAGSATEIVSFLMGCWEASEDQDAEDGAVRDVAAALVALRNSAESLDENVLHNAAQVAASLASRDTQAIAGRMPEAIPLAALMLDALGSGQLGAAEAAIEYFDLLSAVPVAQRAPQLGQPVYASMLPHLAGLASYPQPFTSWEANGDVDSDTFYSFREHVLTDALDTCQKLLQAHYLDHFGQMPRFAATWQAAEAALFALRLYRRRSQSLTYSAGDQTAEDSYLVALFTHLTSPGEKMRHEHPYFMDSAAQLIGSNSAWIASSPQALLEAAVGYLLSALQVGLCSQSAASAFKFVCSNAPQERAASLFTALLPAVTPILQITGADACSWEGKVEVVEGLSSLIGIAKLTVANAADAARQLALPFAQRAEELSSSQGAEQQDTLAGSLTLLASAINRLEFLTCAGASAEQQPAACLVTASMPHLLAISQQRIAIASSAVTAALCKVFKHALQALGPAGDPVLNQVVPALGVVFQGDPQACIQVLTTAVDMSQDWPASQGKLGHTINQLAAGIIPLLQGSNMNPDLAAAWFSLLAHCLVDDPARKREALVSRVAEVVPHHFGLAVHCLQRQEDDLVRALIAFLRSALGLYVVNSADVASSCIQAYGQLLMRELLRAVAVSCPQRIMRSLAVMLHGLLVHPLCGQLARTWFAQCLADDEVLGRALQVDERQKICHFALNMNATAVGSFGALMKDMSSIARNEVNCEVLLSYEL